jgi:antitoxin component of RelBE/YafQ-DinJ toxin-antitoxin module
VAEVCEREECILEEETECYHCMSKLEKGTRSTMLTSLNDNEKYCGRRNSNMKMERERILEDITKKVTRDNGECFINTERLDYIKSKLKESDYEIFQETPLSVIYKKKNVDLSERVVLISTHVDCVEKIQHPDFKVTKKGNYKGTFDNAATNAVAVIAMLEKRFSDNVLISFTGDEEEDSNGAKQVIEFLANMKKKVIAIALDVTFDLMSEKKEEITTFKNASYTIDNLCCNTSEIIAKTLFDIAKEMQIPFMVTRADDENDYFANIENKIPDYYDERLEVEGTADLDEAIKYSENKCCIGAFSLCLPSNDTKGDMHSDNLIKIKKNSFNGYLEALVQISNRMTEE